MFTKLLFYLNRGDRKFGWRKKLGQKNPAPFNCQLSAPKKTLKTLGVVAILTLFSFYFSLMISTSIIYVGEARLNSWKKRVFVSLLHKTADCLIYSILFFHTLRYSLNTTSVRIEVNCHLYPFLPLGLRSGESFGFEIISPVFFQKINIVVITLFKSCHVHIFTRI